MPERVRPWPRPGSGTLLCLAAVALFVILWFPVLIGQRSLLGGDVLYEFLPWSAEPGAHAPSNTIVDDPMLQMLPWQELVAQQVWSGRLPLWNPSVQSGAPLLANDQSAVFSPFTWFALLFPAAIGLSLAMLAKLLLAGLGMAVYLRTLKASGVASALGGIAYASSSFMVVWLAWPHAAVAAIMPWTFAFVEIYLRASRRWALASLAFVVGLQFLAGHAETSLHFGLALGMYVIVRWGFSHGRGPALAWLGAAALIGTMLAAIQLVPFFDLLRHATLVSDRTSSGLGFAHLSPSALSSWIFPNVVGNPGIDGRYGRLPNYNEATGFAGVTALLLSPIGAWWAWRRERSAAIALVGIGTVAAAIVYGPLSPIVGRLPVLGTSNNERLLVVICFSIAALGGLGLDGLLQARPWRVVGALAHAYWVGITAVLVVVAAGLGLAISGQGVDHLLPGYHSYIGFWVAVGVVSVGAALAFVAAGLFGGPRRVAATGLCALALAEAAIFAGPFNPREPLNSVPPPSPSVAWLQAHAGARPVAALGTVLIPETASLYGLTDARGYEVLTDRRVRLFWSTADPGYSDSNLIMSLGHPRVDWLAAAGVAYLMMPADQSLPGAPTVYSEHGVAIAEVPDPRPFVYAATSVVSAGGPDEAAAILSEAPLGPIVVESCCPAAGSAEVTSVLHEPGSVQLDVMAVHPATIVLQQAFQPGWEARVDGQIVEILPADVLFQAVTVPAGHHHITLTYRPSSVTLGAAVTAIGALGLFLFVVVPLYLRRRARSG